MQGMTTFIMNLLRRRRFARPSDAPNSIIAYARRQRHLPYTEHENVEDEARPSQLVPTRHTRHRHDDEAGPSQTPARRHLLCRGFTDEADSSQEHSQPDSPILFPCGRGRHELSCLLR